ncbi:putative diguanylate cyclase [Escherichia coli]|uniref:Putative diguanylate cyclase n=1 Tax=Escherichia coli TaxID=562 RepID=A0A377AMD1_ECOLX|nr:putative diguanylate cyclase [Escherichia coli]
MISAWLRRAASAAAYEIVAIDVLKIDKMFVEGLPGDSSMIAAIIMLAQSLNLQMIGRRRGD